MLDIGIADVLQHILKRGIKAKITTHNLKLFYPEWSDRDLRSLATVHTGGIFKGEKGRPTAIYGMKKYEEQLAIAHAFYEKFDIFQIAERTGIDVNFVCYFLLESTVPFGVAKCKKCGHNYVYVRKKTACCFACEPAGDQNENIGRTSHIEAIGQDSFLCRDMENCYKFMNALQIRMRDQLMAYSMVIIYGDLLGKIFYGYGESLNKLLSHMGHGKSSTSTVLDECRPHYDAVVANEKTIGELRKRFQPATKDALLDPKSKSADQRSKNKNRAVNA